MFFYGCSVFMDFTVFTDLKKIFTDFHGFGFQNRFRIIRSIQFIQSIIQSTPAFSNTRSRFWIGFEVFFCRFKDFNESIYIFIKCVVISLSLSLQQQQKILSKHLLLSRENVILCLPEAIVDRFISLPNLIYSNVIII